MFGMMLELGKPEPTRFHTWKGGQPWGAGAVWPRERGLGLNPLEHLWENRTESALGQRGF